jgi:hypothetical protein
MIPGGPDELDLEVIRGSVPAVPVRISGPDTHHVIAGAVPAISLVCGVALHAIGITGTGPGCRGECQELWERRGL